MKEINTLGLISGIAMGFNFGVWMQNIHSGFVACLIIWLVFYFKCNKN